MAENEEIDFKESRGTTIGDQIETEYMTMKPTEDKAEGLNRQEIMNMFGKLMVGIEKIERRVEHVAKQMAEHEEKIERRVEQIIKQMAEHEEKMEKQNELHTKKLDHLNEIQKEIDNRVRILEDLDEQMRVKINEIIEFRNITEKEINMFAQAIGTLEMEVSKVGKISKQAIKQTKEIEVHLDHREKEYQEKIIVLNGRRNR